VSHQWVATALHELGYSLQANRKTREGTSHPDRDAQFAQINAAATTFLAAGDPVVSVDTKKKELVGDVKNGGREWQPVGEPEAVRMHDFVRPELGRVNPYGIDDLAHNTGWVNVGIDHDTAAFAVASLRRWWQQWVTGAAVEMGIAAPGRRDGTDDQRLPLAPPARASGTRSSTATFRSSVRTGAASR
jgi:hypothetical protein